MAEVTLSKSADLLICQMYKLFLKRKKAKTPEEKAAQMGDLDQICEAVKRKSPWKEI